MFNNLSQREIVIIIVGILVLSLAFYYFNIYLPLQDKIKNAKSLIDQKENNIEILKNISDKLPETKKRYQQLRTKDKSNEITIKSAADLLKKISKLENQHNVNLTSFNPINTKNGIEVNMIYLTNFENLIYLFEDFQSLSNQLQFNNLNLTQNNEKMRAAIKVKISKGGEEKNDD